MKLCWTLYVLYLFTLPRSYQGYNSLKFSCALSRRGCTFSLHISSILRSFQVTSKATGAMSFRAIRKISCSAVLSSSSSSPCLERLVGRLTPRLRAILELVPKDVSVADIGADHGILSAALTSVTDKRIFAVERSRQAADSGLLKLIDSLQLQSQVEAIVGDGLHALIDAREAMNRRVGEGLAADYVDTIILAGMGTHTAAQILTGDPLVDMFQPFRRDAEDDDCTTRDDRNSCNNISSRPSNKKWRSCDNGVKGISDSGSPLERLSVQRVILQPWPPNLLSLLALYRVLLDGPWVFEAQSIIKEGRYFYITSSFVRRRDVDVVGSKIASRLDFGDVLVMNPLSKGRNTGADSVHSHWLSGDESKYVNSERNTSSISNERRVLWAEFLRKQRTSVELNPNIQRMQKFISYLDWEMAY